MSTERLPEELLIRIFRVLRDAPPRTHRWIIVTHVCQGWRQIALNAAELWTFIHSGNTDIVKAFVLRSQQAPLDIRYVTERTKDGTQTVMNILLPQAYRIRSMHLRAPHSANLFLQYSFPEGAPLLRSLDLHHAAFSGGRNDMVTANASGTDLPEICRQGIPHLRHLHLFAWPRRDVDSLRGLMTASLRSLKVSWPKAPQPVNAWVSILTELPLLEELRLLDALGTTTTSTPEQVAIPSVRLPYLTDLTIIDARPEETVAMLQRIIPADNVGITVKPNSFFGSPATSVAQLLEVLNQKFAPRRHSASFCHPTFLSMRLTENTSLSGYQLTLSAPLYDNDRDKCPGCAPRDTRQILKLHLLGVRLAQDAVAALLCGMLSKTFPLSSLKVLELDTVYDPHMRGTGLLVPSACRELFPQMNSLRVLSIGAVYVDTDSTQSLGNIGSSTPISFAVLEALTIRHPPPKQSINFPLLLQTLQLRKDAGYPISRVHVCGGSSKESVVTELRSRLLPLATSLDCRVDYCILPDILADRYIEHVQ